MEIRSLGGANEREGVARGVKQRVRRSGQPAAQNKQLSSVRRGRRFRRPSVKAIAGCRAPMKFAPKTAALRSSTPGKGWVIVPYIPPVVVRAPPGTWKSRVFIKSPENPTALPHGQERVMVSYNGIPTSDRNCGTPKKGSMGSCYYPPTFIIF